MSDTYESNRPRRSRKLNPCVSNEISHIPMIYPWGAKRILKTLPYDSDTLTSLYESFQRGHKEQLLWSLILADTSYCVGMMVVYHGDLTFIGRSSTNLEHVRLCIDKGDIASIFLQSYNTDIDESFIAEGGAWEVHFKTELISAVQYYDGHSCMIIIDPNKRIVELFDPNGVDYERDPHKKVIHEIAYSKLRSALKLDGYSMCSPSVTCPRIGPQGVSDDSMCYMWSMLYLHLRLKNPSMGSDQINSEMIRETKGKVPLVIDYMMVMRDTIKELSKKYSLYDSDVLQRVNTLRERVRHIGAMDVAKDILKWSDTSQIVHPFADKFANTQAVVYHGHTYLVCVTKEKDKTARMSERFVSSTGDTKWINAYIAVEDVFEEEPV